MNFQMTNDKNFREGFENFYSLSMEMYQNKAKQR